MTDIREVPAWPGEVVDFHLMSGSRFRNSTPEKLQRECWVLASVAFAAATVCAQKTGVRQSVTKVGRSWRVIPL